MARHISERPGLIKSHRFDQPRHPLARGVLDAVVAIERSTATVALRLAATRRYPQENQSQRQNTPHTGWTPKSQQSFAAYAGRRKRGHVSRPRWNKLVGGVVSLDMRLVALMAMCVLAVGCRSGAETPRPDVKRATAAQASRDGPLWFLGGDGPGSVFGRSGPLYHINTTTGVLTRVAMPKPLWSVTALSVSPDGRRIALSNGGGEFPPRNLYVMRTDGSGLRRITTGNYYEIDPAWSPDASEIMFSSTRCCATAHYSGDYGIYTVRPDGSGLRLLRKDSGSNDLDPVWSPDGRRIAFVQWPMSSNNGWAIWVMNANGTNAHPLTHDGRYADAIAWSPTGRQLAYTSHLSDNADWQIRVVQADGHHSHTIFTCTTPCANGGYTLAWSPDGKQIAFTIDPHATIAPRTRPRIALINATGAGYHLLTTIGTGACCLSWISHSRTH
jgi:dipeptidyl aminopeptidase/acylaminoacyl peptidase